MITWSDNFSTGVERIDRDHQALIGILNELEDAIARGRGSHVIAETIQRLSAYAQSHFTHEEACMFRVQCPVAGANKQAHAKFLQTVQASGQRLAGGGGALAAQQVFRDLSDWMVNHILKIDTALRGCPNRPA